MQQFLERLMPPKHRCTNPPFLCKHKTAETCISYRRRKLSDRPFGWRSECLMRAFANAGFKCYLSTMQTWSMKSIKACYKRLITSLFSNSTPPDFCSLAICQVFWKLPKEPQKAVLQFFLLFFDIFSQCSPKPVNRLWCVESLEFPFESKASVDLSSPKTQRCLMLRLWGLRNNNLLVYEIKYIFDVCNCPMIWFSC